MEPVFEKLSCLLEEQAALYREITGLAERKQQYLVKGMIPELDEVTRKEEALIYQIGRREEERLPLMQKLASLYQLDENATLRDVLALAPEAEKAGLGEVAHELMEIMAQLDQLNQQNTGLIQQSLNFISFAMDAISPQSKPTYNASKEVKVERLTQLLDKKV